VTLARHEITGLVADLPDEVIDHPVIGKLQHRVSTEKPRVIPEPGHVAKAKKTDAKDDK